mmetsp:Transcript_49330/g.148546  ORF Transcript_49330/g.148546 Transcript_49330/m.148546 type:complete len:236 (+) Transcript_49330:823-1530(+)
MEAEINRLREQNRRILSDGHRNEALRCRLDELERTVGSLTDDEAGSGGDGSGGLTQAQLRRARNAREEGATDGSTAYRQVLQELQEVRTGLAQVAERVDATAIDTFILKQVLQVVEAVNLIEAILHLAKVEVSTSGAFTLDGDRYKVGFVSSRLSLKQTYIWKNIRQVKVMNEYNGAKPVVHWFETCRLSCVYEKHTKGATVKVFGTELLSVASGESSGVRPSRGTAQDRQQLFR